MWGGIAGSQPMGTAVHITLHGTQINFGDLVYSVRYLRVEGIQAFGESGYGPVPDTGFG